MVTVNDKGYAQLSHVLIHRTVAEKALGRKLRGTEQVHHVNEDKEDFTPTNLVICPDSEYHQLLHKRSRAQKACGDPNYMKCRFCNEWGNPSQGMHVNNSSNHHLTCYSTYMKAHRRKHKPLIRDRRPQITPEQITYIKQVGYSRSASVIASELGLNYQQVEHARTRLKHIKE